VEKFTQMVDWVTGLPGRIWDALGNAGSWLLEKGRSFIQGLWDGITQRFSSAVSWVSGIPGRILSALGNAGSWLLEKGRSFIQGLWDGVTQRFSSAMSWVSGIPGRILSALGNVAQTLWDAGKSIISGFFSGLTSAWEGVKSWFGGIGSWIADHKGPKSYDLALLVPAGGYIMTGLQTGLKKSLPSLRRTLTEVSDTVRVGINPTSMGVGSVGGATTVVNVSGTLIDKDAGKTIAGLVADYQRRGGRR
jgi:phage-related protein